MPEDEAQIRSKVLLTGLDDRVCHPTTGTLVIAVLEESHRALSLPCMWSVGVMGTARSVIVCCLGVHDRWHLKFCKCHAACCSPGDMKDDNAAAATRALLGGIALGLSVMPRA